MARRSEETSRYLGPQVFDKNGLDRHALYGMFPSWLGFYRYWWPGGDEARGMQIKRDMHGRLFYPVTWASGEITNDYELQDAGAGS